MTNGGLIHEPNDDWILLLNCKTGLWKKIWNEDGWSSNLQSDTDTLIVNIDSRIVGAFNAWVV